MDSLFQKSCESFVYGKSLVRNEEPKRNDADDASHQRRTSVSYRRLINLWGNHDALVKGYCRMLMAALCLCLIQKNASGS